MVASPTEDKIEVTAVTKVFAAGRGARESVTAVSDVTFAVRNREVVCLLGPSGCGKSTVLNMIAGFDHPTSGEISVDGKLVTRPGPNRGVVLQLPSLFPWLTTWQNVTCGPRWCGAAAREYRDDANQIIRSMGLVGFEHVFPYQLSGGMRQRVAIARALINNPAVLLLDEPFGALDAQTRLQMQLLVRDIWRAYHTTVLFVTHDVDEAILLGDRILVMSARPGRISHEMRVDLDKSDGVQALGSEAFAALKRTLLGYIFAELSDRVDPIQMPGVPG